MRDSILGENVVWQGRPHRPGVPRMWQGAAVLCFTAAFVAVSFAIVSALVLGIAGVSLLVVGLLTATMGLLCLQGPRILAERTEYRITDRHVVCIRGPFRTTIARDGISYVRIAWSRTLRGIGDVELVRAVPTGPLKRRHLVRLADVAAPDKLWELISGRSTTNQPNWDGRAVSQRLLSGERVLWSAHSRPQKFPYLPRGSRQWRTLALAMFLWVSVAKMLAVAIGGLVRMAGAGLSASPGAFALVIGAEGVTLLLLIAAASFLTHDAVIKPAQLLRHTHYIITNLRFLIERDFEELLLDRNRIVDVINAPAMRGFRDLFLVLDGPRARALAMSGAFGEVERGVQLRPVLESVDDADSALAILLGGDDSTGTGLSTPHSAS